MNKKTLVTFIGIYLFFYILNYLYPLCFGDDYLYSFVWQGNPMGFPLTEEAKRVSSFNDLFVSQYSLYFTWGGRIVGQTLTQLFMWLGKGTFNIFNALISTLLVAEIYWISNKGSISAKFSLQRVCWIFFVIWAFSPGFSPLFLWLTCACVYIWPMFFLLLFLMPYVKKYYNFHSKIGNWPLFPLGMFLIGLISGFGSENCVCWIILALCMFLFFYRKIKGKELWMYTGLIGIILGYLLLIFAPGNAARLYAEHGTDWFTIKLLKDNLLIFIAVLVFQFLLWHFNLKSLYKLNKENFKKRIIQKDILLVKVACILALGMTATMLLSPFFPPRSGFPGTIQLIIAASILLRLENQNNLELVPHAARKFLFCVGTIYYVISASATLLFYYDINLEMTAMINSVKQVQRTSEEQIINVPPFKTAGTLQDALSGFHLSSFYLSDNKDDWRNVSFARYYGIKGIRMVKNEGKDGGETAK